VKAKFEDMENISLKWDGE